MNIFLQLLVTAAILYAVYIWRVFAHETLDYKEARRQEIRRWLQAEAKNEEILNQRLKGEVDEITRMDINMEFARERSRRLNMYLLKHFLEEQN